MPYKKDNILMVTKKKDLDSAVKEAKGVAVVIFSGQD